MTAGLLKEAGFGSYCFVIDVNASNEFRIPSWPASGQKTANQLLSMNFNGFFVFPTQFAQTFMKANIRRSFSDGKPGKPYFFWKFQSQMFHVWYYIYLHLPQKQPFM